MIRKNSMLFLFWSLSLFFFFFYNYSSSADYISYLNWYELSISSINGDGWVFIKDPGYYLLSSISSFFGLGIGGVLFFLVFLSITTKSVYIYSTSNDGIAVWLMLLYLSRLYIPHDLIQFRAGASIGLSSLFVLFYLKNKKFVSYLFLLGAVSIHLSSLLALVVIPVSYFLRKNTNGAVFWKIIAMFLITLSILFINPYQLLLNMLLYIPMIQDRIFPYVSGAYETYNVSILNSYVIIKLISYCFFIYWVYLNRKTNLINKHYYLFFSFFMSFTGLFLFWFFRANDSLAIRFSDFYAFYDLCFLSLLFIIFKGVSKIIYSVFLFLSCIIFCFSSLSLLNL